MRRVLTIPALLVLVIIAAGCTKDPVSRLKTDETRLFITNHDSTVNFTGFKTFNVSDSVAIISNDHQRKKTRDSYDSLVIAAITTQMKSRGFTQVSNKDKPDLGINVSQIINSYTGLVDYGNYYDSYYDYWDPYPWGYPGYGYYSPYVGTYQVNEGVLSVDMFDLKDAAANAKIKSIWNGVIRGEGIFNSSSVDQNVKALFEQSSYIHP
jgi:hypothetical protein